MEGTTLESLGERFLKYVLSMNKDVMNIKFHEMDNDGQITFLFPMSDITDESLRIDLEKRQGKLMSSIGAFYVNMIGEMVIMKNITKFFEYYRDMSDMDYDAKVASMEYVSFGIGCNGGFVSMVFHSSLLYNIFMALLGNSSEEHS